jgi:hypothetical protein
LSFGFYGEEGSSSSIALLCDGEQPRVQFNARVAELGWPEWEDAWSQIEQLQGPCRDCGHTCPPEPDTHVALRDGVDLTECDNARSELVDLLERVAASAGIYAR